MVEGLNQRQHLHRTIGVLQVLHQQPDARALLLQCHPSLCAPSNDAVQLQANATRSSPARFHVPKSPLATL